MELSERQKNILLIMVKNHINEGEPIGSKVICEMLGGQISSATIRNEMSYLTSLGFLEQPHTSAGRVPTAKAYRMYVNGLLSNECDEDMKHYIDVKLEAIKDNYETLSENAAELLSDITGLPAVSVLTHSDSAFIKRLEVLPIGKTSVLVVMVSSDGLAKSRMCNLGVAVTKEKLLSFEKISAKEIVGTELSQFTDGFMQSLASKTGDIALIPLFNTVYEMVKDLLSLKLDFRGEDTILHDDNSASALRLMEYISRRDAIISVLASVNDPISIVFGEEEKSAPTSFIVANHSGGKIGVLGPTRMSYENVIPSISYFAKKLGDIISKAVTDME